GEQVGTAVEHDGGIVERGVPVAAGMKSELYLCARIRNAGMNGQLLPALAGRCGGTGGGCELMILRVEEMKGEANRGARPAAPDLGRDAAAGWWRFQPLGNLCAAALAVDVDGPLSAAGVLQTAAEFKSPM